MTEPSCRVRAAWALATVASAVVSGILLLLESGITWTCACDCYRASRPAHVWSALRGNELRQKVLWVPREDVRRRADFSDTGFEQCRASGKPCRRFSRQAVPLQTEIEKMHAPHGTLPWDPQHLLRPFVSTGEAAGDSQ